MDKCKSCGAEIIWTTTKNGKKMPVDAKPIKRIILKKNNLIEFFETGIEYISEITDTYVSHFSTCPMANKHRSKKEKNQ